MRGTQGAIRLLGQPCSLQGLASSGAWQQELQPAGLQSLPTSPAMHSTADTFSSRPLAAPCCLLRCRPAAC